MMRKTAIVVISAVMLIIAGCGISPNETNGNDSGSNGASNNSSTNRNAMHMMNGHMGSLSTNEQQRKDDNDMQGHMSHNRNMNGHMDHENIVPLQASTGENKLAIPALLEPDKKGVYTVKAQQGKTAFFEGVLSETFGYNGDLLGPIIRLKQGEQAAIRIVNELKEETTFHWHGLEVAGQVDGGPHDPLQAGDEQLLKFDITQEAATLWFHPHPHNNTASQVYRGLAGLLYIEDENSAALPLPKEHGKNDFPLVFQDRLFNEAKQLDYEHAYYSDGTVGDTLLINGTVNPYLEVKREQVRLRLLNGANARNITFRLNTGDEFHQIATDGGLLNAPVAQTEITLTPSERAEIIVDFSLFAADQKIELVDEHGTVLLPFHIERGGKANSEPLPKQMNDYAVTEAEKALPISKKVELFGMMNMVYINGKKFDPDRVDLTQQKGVTEVWEIYNEKDMMGGMIHPFHIHGTQFKVISRDGVEPLAHEQGWKDSISVAPGERVKIAVTFEHEGLYMFHCHILEHEDSGMMGQIKVE
ncbi:multicopper oxidase family protein [Paenibacillus yanchengensis]|uniref:Multicopper oxidase family protein n=1 Tax=Paenibacillus yanchengensis TaxID=2035833 RepID=A0ABW4YN77_9BACL